MCTSVGKFIFQAGQHQSFGSSPATSFNLASPPSLPPNINPSPNMLPHPSPGGLLANSPSNPLHVPSPAGLMPTSSPGPCPTVPVGHSPASSFMGQTGRKMRMSVIVHVLWNVIIASVCTSYWYFCWRCLGESWKIRNLLSEPLAVYWCCWRCWVQFFF